MKSGWLSSLTETHNDVVAEILRFGIFHIGDEHSDPGRIGCTGGAGVTQLNGFFQNGLLHPLADILRVIQRLGNGALGNAQFMCDIIQCSQNNPLLLQNMCYYITEKSKMQSVLLKIYKKFRNVSQKYIDSKVHKNKKGYIDKTTK